jgi:SAM-dependent methyltransferase
VTDLFDMALRASRRDRAARSGPVLFAYERAFSDILERLAEINREFFSALLIGAPDSSWPAKLAENAGKVTAVDPGAEFARRAGGAHAQEDALGLEPGNFDLIVAVGTLDTLNNLPETLLRLKFLLKPDSLLIGAIAGGDTLPRLRQAMRAADSVMGAATPHVHPRIEASAFAHLLSAAGFAMPVVDIDRMRVAYGHLRDLIADLRGMAATNILTARPRTPLTRAAMAAAEAEFTSSGADSRTTEVFEILHFAAWTASATAAGTNG